MIIFVIIACTICLVVGFVISLLLPKRILLNSGEDAESTLFSPDFLVVKIERCVDHNSNTIAKYTIGNYFFKGKNKHSNTLTFYDATDKYKVGDVLILKERLG